ncbi:hypothetical protein OAU35_00330 [bacterium]|nr:hypothetical protein [bacterium]
MFKKFQALGKAIKSIKPNVPKTELQKKLRDLKIATQKSKAGKAKLDQTIFELKNNKDFTFKSKKGKSESNTEAYKRIQKDNTKVLKGMLDKATEKKADGGRIGLKHGSYETVPPSKGFSEYVTKEKQKKIDEANKKANEKDKPGGLGPMGRAAGRKEAKVGGRIGRKMGGGSDMSNTNVKKKFKGFSKLPETVQIKINKKLAKKV